MSVTDARYPNLSQETLGAVDWFALDMKRKLEAHHTKGQRDVWLDTDSFRLVDSVWSETEELQIVLIKMGDSANTYEQQMQAIIDKAADVANFAMMIADKARERLRACQVTEQKPMSHLE